ncbi:methyltransferase-like 26 [Portunus trituberculatus]|uniref:methyltransferase-like 26 n=1 Tax=Portunus trituberculatus TaxID=210409 RepID=UPI001E1CE6AD|nr:methyltransferase-like 26 [Portunus trituberculatus]
MGAGRWQAIYTTFSSRLPIVVARSVASKMAENKLVFEAPEKNKDPIAAVLDDVLPEKFGADASLKALEVASGTGQHVVHLAQRFPKVSWQPSEVEEKYTASIKAYVEESGVGNVLEPLLIDVCKPVSEWPGKFSAASLDVIVNINMVHISPWPCTEALFKAAGHLLKAKGIMVTYGPYAIHGEITPESNVAFNQSLKSQNAEWGLRDIDDLEKEAKKNGMTFDAMFNMPANNKILVWQKAENESE